MFVPSTIIVQGITGRQGRMHTRLMLDYGTRIVAGVTPKRKGEEVCGIPVYNTVKEALKKHSARWSIIFVPAMNAKSAALEAINNNLNIVWITEHVPIRDALEVIRRAKEKNVVVIGPNSPGIALSNMKIGIIPNIILSKGSLGIISRSGTLAHELLYRLTTAGIGQRAVIGIGGDPLIGTSMIDVVRWMNKKKTITKILIIGEIGGTQEEEAARYIALKVKKSVVAFIAGTSAPRGKQMGHAGAIIKGENTAEHKILTLKKAGVKIALHLNDVVTLLQ
jgi:succinyl-CoA synthetase alpha subunit